MPHYDLDGRLVVLNRLPDLQGYVGDESDERYRVYTQKYLPWGVLPLWEDGGPQTIALTSWTVQYLTDRDSCADPGYAECRIQLYVHRTMPCDHDSWMAAYGLCSGRRRGCTRAEDHPTLCWTWWSGISAARAAAYDAELIGLKVLERDAARHGFRPEPP